MRGYAAGELKTDFRSFENWWGRGQQYLGLVRTTGGKDSIRTAQ